MLKLASREQCSQQLTADKFYGKNMTNFSYPKPMAWRMGHTTPIKCTKTHLKKVNERIGTLNIAPKLTIS